MLNSLNSYALCTKLTMPYDRMLKDNNHTNTQHNSYRYVNLNMEVQ